MYALFFFNDTATTEIYTLSLHDALPISRYLFLTKETEEALSGLMYGVQNRKGFITLTGEVGRHTSVRLALDRKSTRLNSSHGYISYAVFCLKKKNKTQYRWSVELSL